MGTLRKYLFNGAIVSAVLGGVSTLRSQRKAPNDWRTALNWVAWALTLIVAIGTVQLNSQEADPTRPTKGKPNAAKGPKPIKDKRKKSK